MRILILALVALVACGGTTTSVPVHAELTPALEPVAWLLGDWRSDQSDVHWVAAGGTLYRLGMNHEDRWGLWIIDDGDGESDTADGVRRCIVINFTDGEVTATETSSADDRVTYAARIRGTMDLTIDLRRDGAALIERVVADVGDGHPSDVPEQFTAAPAVPAPAAEAADRAFDADTAARGADGWVAAFAPGGSMWRKEAVTGADAIRAAIEPTLSKGHLRWHPIASRVLNDNGAFTVGTATFTPNGATEPTWRGSYITIWVKQDDGTWKVAFDTGRTAQPPK